MMLRAALGRKPGLRDGQNVPRFEAAMNQVEVTQLAQYQAICGFRPSPLVPVTLPQVIAAPLHMAVFTHPSFPLPALGMVHVASRITQRRPLRADEAMDILVWVEGQRPARQGCEVDLMTEIRVEGQAVWESVTTVLSRSSSGHGQKSERPPIPNPEPSHRASWSMASDLGRRYGKIAGDRNPIHLWPITAKLFGFKRHIIHGMWLLGWAMAELQDEIGTESVSIDVSFKRPVFLPATPTFSAGDHDGTLAVRLAHPDRGQTHLVGPVPREASDGSLSR